MDWTSAKMRVIFKNFEFGVTGGMPLFRILPEKITSGENGICHIDSARRVTVVLGLETLEQGFAVLLDKKGRLQNMPQEIFGNPCQRLHYDHGRGEDRLGQTGGQAQLDNRFDVTAF